MENKIWYLKNADLFSWMNQDEIEEMARTHSAGKCDPDESFPVVGRL